MQCTGITAQGIRCQRKCWLTKFGGEYYCRDHRDGVIGHIPVHIEQRVVHTHPKVQDIDKINEYKKRMNKNDMILIKMLASTSIIDVKKYISSVITHNELSIATDIYIWYIDTETITTHPFVVRDLSSISHMKLSSGTTDEATNTIKKIYETLNIIGAIYFSDDIAQARKILIEYFTKCPCTLRRVTGTTTTKFKEIYNGTHSKALEFAENIIHTTSELIDIIKIIDVSMDVDEHAKK